MGEDKNENAMLFEQTSTKQDELQILWYGWRFGPSGTEI